MREGRTTEQRVQALGAAVTELLAHPLVVPAVPHAHRVSDAHERATQSLRARTSELLAALVQGDPAQR